MEVLFVSEVVRNVRLDLRLVLCVERCQVATIQTKNTLEYVRNFLGFLNFNQNS